MNNTTFRKTTMTTIEKKQFVEAIEVAKRKIKEQGIEEKCSYIQSMEINEEYERMDFEEIRYGSRESTMSPQLIQKSFQESIVI